MSKIKLEDLSPDQLRAQVRLCFKFMEQCLCILNGEEVSDEAAIRLVDPIGQSSDMELFYKCKQIGGAGDLADAMETIDKLQKKIDKLQKRLAKKHDELEELKEGRIGNRRKDDGWVANILKELEEGYYNMLDSFKLREHLHVEPFGLVISSSADGDIPVGSPVFREIKNFRSRVLSSERPHENWLDSFYPVFKKGEINITTERNGKTIIEGLDLLEYNKLRQFVFGLRKTAKNSSPKYPGGKKLYFMNNNIVTQGEVYGIFGMNDGTFKYNMGSYTVPESELFESVEDLLESLRKKISDGEGK